MKKPNSFLSGSRKELTRAPMKLVEGKIPESLQGSAYIITQMGNVNSKGLPFSRKHADGTPNHDYQSPIMNGDGFVFKFDFSDGEDVHLTTRIMRPPDFYADHATRYGGPASKDEKFAHYGFKNLGISRMSFHLGSRNFLNTAFQPLQFKGDSGTAILTTDDIGRPYLADPDTLELITPIGLNSDWISSMPNTVAIETAAG